jgi:hypothetical protein
MPIPPKAPLPPGRDSAADLITPAARAAPPSFNNPPIPPTEMHF